MDAHYYKDYYRLEREHWWFTVRANILQDTLKRHVKKQHLSILNVGVATGATTLFLQKFGSVTSVEYDKACCTFVNEKLNLNVINASATDLPFQTDSFDLVCCYDVIEHIEDDKLAFSEIKRVCKKDGLIHLTVPAYMFLWSEHDEINHHFRRYTMQNLLSVCKNQDTAIVYKTYFNAILFLPVAFFRVLKNIVTRILPKQERALQSDFHDFKGKDSFSNRLFFVIFDFERWMLSKGLRFPFGVSVQVLIKNSKPYFTIARYDSSQVSK